jgi:hypothetical protein
MLAGPGARLRASLDEDSGLFPLDAQSVITADAKAIDAFLQRFQQVSDLLLRKAFPRLLAALEERDERHRFRDMLDELERFGVIESADLWSDINDLRNRLVHEYAMDPEPRSRELNLAWSMAPLLIEAVQRCLSYLDEGRSA